MDKKIEKEDSNQKTKKNSSKPKPDGLKPKAIKWKKKAQIEKEEISFIA